ncbi:hypothetical protein ACOZ38_22265 [Sphaerisporangium viridialbum]|uniref:hypothetical protein n=1 Tax=Sphaerisporangium viridialbum TaxID=46189 RepID=UPI003C76963F
MTSSKKWLLTGCILGTLGAVGAASIITSSIAQTRDEEPPPLQVSDRLPGHDPEIMQAVEDLFAGAGIRHAVTEELIYRCMTGKGLPYVKRKAPAHDVNPTLGSDTYGTPLSEASRVGYRSKERLQTSEDTDTSGFGELSATDQQRWGEAFFGKEDAPVVSVTLPQGGTTDTSSDGCLSQARSLLYGSLADWLKWGAFAGFFAIEARQHASSDPRIADLNRRWSDCMDKSGYKGIKDPESARELAASGHALHRLSSEEAHSKEIELATSDAKCDSTLGYSKSRRKIEDEYYTAALVKHKSNIASLRKMNDRALTEAHRILGN